MCGNPVIWKPSEKTPLTALAVQALFERASARVGGIPAGLSTVLIGGRDVGEALVDDPRVPLVSATGSTAMGRMVGPRLAQRFARAILELGGNNASVVCPSADLDLALRAISFAAIGTAGQRCTSLRRLFIHDSVYDELVVRLQQVYGSVRIGNPLANDSVLAGPLIDKDAFEKMQNVLLEAQKIGGEVYGGERVDDDKYPSAYYVRPALVEMPAQIGPMLRETFAPILYVMKYSDLDVALALHNDVPQDSHHRSSRMMSAKWKNSCPCWAPTAALRTRTSVHPARRSAAHSAVKKETGGGREAGSDAWKAYMRRVTSTINFGHELPLAQGVKFDV